MKAFETWGLLFGGVGKGVGDIGGRYQEDPLHALFFLSQVSSERILATSGR